MIKSVLKLLLTFTLFFSSSSESLAAEFSADSRLKEITTLANVVLAASEELMPPTETCGMTAPQGKQISLVVRKAMDREIAEYIGAAKQAKAYGKKEWLSCVSECSCVTYASVLERVGFESLSLEDKKIYRRVSSLAREQTSQSTKKCVRENQEVCASDIFRSIR